MQMILLFAGFDLYSDMQAAALGAIFYLVAIAIIFAALGLAAKKYLGHGKWKIILRLTSKPFTSALMANAHKSDVHNRSSEQRLISKWLEMNSSSEYGIRTAHSAVIADLLKSYFEEDFVVEEEPDWCTLDAIPECTFLWKLTPKDGEQGKHFLVALNTKIRAFTDNKSRHRWIFKNNKEERIQDYELPDNSISIGTGLAFAFSKGIDNSDEDYILLVDSIRRASIEAVEYPEEVDRMLQTRIYRLETSKEGIGLTLIWQTAKNLGKELINATFMPFDITYGEVQQKILPYDFICLATDQVLAVGENSQLFGTYGVGKTTLMQIFMNRLSNLENTLVIFLSASQVRELGKNNMESKLLKYLSPDPDEENPPQIIFVIDEAESVLKSDKDGLHTDESAIILSMLDGDIKQQLGCSTLLIFNARKEDLNQGLFRSGRPGLEARITPLAGKHALNAANALRKKFTNKFFDQAMFDKIYNEENTLPKGTVYAKPGEITIADLVHRCFKRREFHSAVIEAIKRMQMPDESAPTPARPTIPAKPTTAPVPVKPIPAVKKPKFNKPGNR